MGGGGNGGGGPPGGPPLGGTGGAGGAGGGGPPGGIPLGGGGGLPGGNPPGGTALGATYQPNLYVSPTYTAEQLGKAFSQLPELTNAKGFTLWQKRIILLM